MTDRPNYWGILPAPVRYARTLPAPAKVLYAEIAALCERDGYCRARNDYFAGLYEVDIATVSRWVSSLAAAGFIRVEVDKATGNKRRIYPLDSMGQAFRVSEVMQRKDCKDDKSAATSPQKRLEGSPQNCNPRNKTRFKKKTHSVYGGRAGARLADAVVLELEGIRKSLIDWASRVPKGPPADFAEHVARYLRAFLEHGEATAAVMAGELAVSDETLLTLCRRYHGDGSGVGDPLAPPQILPSDETMRALRGD